MHWGLDRAEAVGGLLQLEKEGFGTQSGET